MQRNQELDSLRAFAILFVMISHWTNYGSWGGYSFGAFGVDIFFCLSGFLMTLILLKARSQVVTLGKWAVMSRFYIRRVLRIFPVYYCALFILLFFATSTGLKSHFSSFALFTSNFYFYTLGHWDGMISHFWTLSVEIQFYLIWPFILLFLPKKFLRPLFFLGILIGLLARSFVYYWGPLEAEHLDMLLVLPQSCVDLFCFGALTASYFLEEDGLLFGQHQAWAWVLPILSLLLLGLVLYFQWPALVFYRSIIGLAMVYVLSFCLKKPQGVLGTVLRLRPLVYLGQISYGVYIYHNLAEFFVLKFVEPGPVALISMFLLVLVMAMASWHLLEGPIHRLKSKTLHPKVSV